MIKSIQKIIYILSLVALPLSLNAQMGSTLRNEVKPFIATWNTANTSTGSTGNTTVKLPLYATGGIYGFTVDWGDGTQSHVTNTTLANATHTYASAGTYTITIRGTIRGWSFSNTGDRQKILNVSQWG